MAEVAATRRPAWEESRRRILDAARELFAERGYRGTTTRDLAEAAGVAELTLFRHFPTKAQLFEQAVVAPVHTFLHEFVERRRERPPGGRDQVAATAEFYDELLAELTRDAKLVIALVAALSLDESDGELSQQLQPTMRGMLTDLDQHFAKEFRARGFDVDPRIGLRIMVAMALGIAVHGEWLFPVSRRPSRKRLVEEMTKLTTWGLAGRPPTTG